MFPLKDRKELRNTANSYTKLQRALCVVCVFSVCALNPLVNAAGRQVSPLSDIARGTASNATGRASPYSLWGQQGDGRIHSLSDPLLSSEDRIGEGDTLHIIVRENSRATVTANTDLRRRLEADAELKDWIHLGGFSLSPALREIQPGIDFSSERRTQGRGRRTRRDEMSFRIAAKVEWQLADGLLYVVARKRKKINDEEVTLKLSGYVSPKDIDNQRTVRSENIHDMNLCYTGRGALSSNYTRSFWGWLLDLIWF